MGISLSDREADLMDALWDRGPSTVSEVQAALADDLAYTTVLTILRNLESKGYVRHEKLGRAHRYTPLIAREAARSSALRHLTEKLFKGSPDLLLTHLVSDRALSDRQLRRIRKLLDDAGKEPKP
jgi:BlaI family penicillinase repressor